METSEDIRPETQVAARSSANAIRKNVLGMFLLASKMDVIFSVPSEIFKAFGGGRILYRQLRERRRCRGRKLPCGEFHRWAIRIVEKRNSQNGTKILLTEANQMV